MPNFSRIKTIALKELLVIFSRPVERKLVILPPIILLFIFSYAATMDVKNIDMVVLDQDNGYWSQELCASIEASPTFKSVRRVNSLGELRQAVDHQQALIALVFDGTFSKNIESIKPAKVQVILDGRRSNAALISQGYIMKFINELAQKSPMAQSAKVVKVEVESVNWFNPNLLFPWFQVPNLMGMINMMMSFIITGLSVARERELGTFDQMLVSPATPTEIAIAKLIPGILIALVHGTIFVFGGSLVFSIPMLGSLWILYAGIIVFATAICGIGLLVSSFANTQQQAFLGSFTVAVPLLLISGAVAPVDNMPEFFRILSEADPLRHFLVITQGVFLKGISPEAALLPLGKMLIMAFISTSIAIVVFRRRV